MKVSQIFSTGGGCGHGDDDHHHGHWHGDNNWHESSYRRHYWYGGEDHYDRHDHEGLLEGLGDIL